MAETPKILQVTFGAFSCTLEGFDDPVETLVAVAEYFRGLAATDPDFLGGLRVPDEETLARLIAEAGAGTGTVRMEALVHRHQGAASDRMASGGADEAATTTAEQDAGPGPDWNQADTMQERADDHSGQTASASFGAPSEAGRGEAPSAFAPEGKPAGREHDEPTNRDEAAAIVAEGSDLILAQADGGTQAEGSARASTAPDSGPDTEGSGQRTPDAIQADAVTLAAEPAVADGLVEGLEVPNSEAQELAGPTSADSDLKPGGGTFEASEIVPGTEAATPVLVAESPGNVDMEDDAAPGEERSDQGEVPASPSRTRLWDDESDDGWLDDGVSFSGLRAALARHEVEERGGPGPVIAAEDLRDLLDSAFRRPPAPPKTETPPEPIKPSDATSTDTAEAPPSIMASRAAEAETVDETSTGAAPPEKETPVVAEAATSGADPAAEEVEAEGGWVDGSPNAEPIPASARDWGAGEDEDWFVSRATVQAQSGEDSDPQAAKKRLFALSPDQDESMLRILARAELQLADPDATRRRETMAHLKAAVAATEADRATAETSPESDSGTGFRVDLDAMRPASVVVRPMGAPPPLRLVASQRVDMPGRNEEARPGRVAEAQPTRAEPEPVSGPRAEAAAAATPDNPSARSPQPEPAAPAVDIAPRPEPERASSRPAARRADGFAAFTSRSGAQTLPQVIEAAAAWAAAQGEGDVSRARLLDLAAEALSEPPSREEALRVFGTLLREGRLERVEGGRFRIAADTRYDPARLAG